jgi:ElaA protein
LTTSRWAPFAALSGLDVHDMLALRCQVFVVEQRCAFAEIDGRDPDAVHLLLRGEDGRLEGTLRVFAPAGENGAARIGRIATAPHARGRGLGHTMMREALRFCTERFPGAAIDLSAQEHLAAFYGAHGFTAVSASYLEDDIPHVDMRRLS